MNRLATIATVTLIVIAGELGILITRPVATAEVTQSASPDIGQVVVELRNIEGLLQPDNGATLHTVTLELRAIKEQVCVSAWEHDPRNGGDGGYTLPPQCQP